MTKQHELILRIVREYGGHPTAQDVFLQANRELPHIAFATVYNNLNSLVASGDITRVHIPGEADRFDKAPIARTHAHTFCDSCGAVEDLSECDVIPYIKRQCPFPVLGADVLIHTLCPACRDKSEVTG